MNFIKTLAAALAASLLASSALAALPATAPGAIDPTFGASGKTVSPLAVRYDYGRRLLVQPDGRYLVLGYGSESSQVSIGFVARYTHDGQPDPSFYGTGARIYGDATIGATLIDGAVLPNGKILLIGNLEGNVFADGFLTRLHADGSTDTTFGVDGIVRLTTPGFPWVSGSNVAVMPDGRILAIVQENDQNDVVDRPYALRLLPDGTPDSTFGPNGRVYFGQIASNFQPQRMALTAAGKIVVAGWMWQAGVDTPDLGAVVRLNADGTPDAGFASGGIFTYNPPGHTTNFSDMLVDPADMVVVSGFTGSPLRSGFVIRLKSNGQPDAGFGFQGVLTLPAPTVSAASIARQSDGKLVVGAHIMPTSNFQVQVIRLLANGAFDASFGTAGAALLAGANKEVVYSLAVDPDGKIAVSGTSIVGSADHVMIARVLGTEITTPVVEFYNGTLNHYFITADPNEAAAIDAGAAGPGWARTGQTFKSGGPNRVCRFYGSPDIDPATQKRRGPNSHFYTIGPEECAIVKTDAGWKFESFDFNGWPIAQGVCPQGTQPIKRVYNQRFAQNDSNHRYITTDALYQQMTAQGWAGEGTVFCAAL